MIVQTRRCRCVGSREQIVQLILELLSAILFQTLHEFFQGVSIACYASPVLATIGMSVCLSVSVRPSVTRWH